jgi:CBS domain-containing protein
MELRKSLEDRVSDYASTEYVTVSIGDTVAAAASAMKKAGSGEAVVVQNGEPIGIVTERDILYKVVAAGLDPSKTQTHDVMSAPVEGIDEEARVAEAIAKMTKLGVRRLVVRRGKKIVGMITQKRIVSGGAQKHVDLPELVTPKGIRCPYCDAIVKDAQELSRHIDQLHVGEGLLKGDRRKW